MKRIKLSTRSTLLAGVTAGIFIALPLSQMIYSKQNNSYSTIESKFKVMNQILYFVNQLYYEAVDMETLLDGAFHGIMDQLDPHSVFISAKDQKNINELFKGEFQGVGIEFDILNNYITVISPVIGGPSEKAGIQAGDWIIEIDGESAKGIEREDVYKKFGFVHIQTPAVEKNEALLTLRQMKNKFLSHSKIDIIKSKIKALDV